MTLDRSSVITNVVFDAEYELVQALTNEGFRLVGPKASAPKSTTLRSSTLLFAGINKRYAHNPYSELFRVYRGVQEEGLKAFGVFGFACWSSIWSHGPAACGPQRSHS